MHYFNHEDTSGHFHDWLLPRYSWMDQFGRSVDSVGAVFAHARSTLVSDTDVGNVIKAVDALRQELAQNRPSARESVSLATLPRRRHEPATDAALTAQQVAVFRCVAEGLSNHEIAARLNVSSKTVEFHLSAVRKKLRLEGPDNIRRFVLYAREQYAP